MATITMATANIIVRGKKYRSAAEAAGVGGTVPDGTVTDGAGVTDAVLG